MTALALHCWTDLKLAARSRQALFFFYAFPPITMLLVGAIMTRSIPGYNRQLTPAMFTFAALTAGLLVFPVNLVVQRESGAYKRFRLAGMSARSILASAAASQLGHLVLIGALLVTIGALVYGAPWPAHGAGFLVAVVCVGSAFAGLGAAIATVAETQQSLPILAQLFYLPIMFLGGGPVPTQALPDWCRALGRYLPGIYALSGLGGFQGTEPGLTSPWPSVVVLVAGALAGFTVAGACFRWEPRERAPRWNAIVPVLALSPYLLAGALGIGQYTAAGSAQNTTAPKPAEQARNTSIGDPWGGRLRLPWDTQQAAAQSDEQSGLTSLLNSKLPCARRGKPGESHRYELHRTNLMLDREGRPLRRGAGDAVVSVTLVSPKGDDRWVQRLKWERFAYSEGATSEANLEPVERPGARGVEYTVDPDDANSYYNPPGDFARAGSGAEAYFMKVMAMDATTFEPLALGLASGQPGGGLPIGHSLLRQAERKPASITAPGSGQELGRYQLGMVRTILAGITRCFGEPCVLMWFSAEGNRVEHEFAVGEQGMRTRATEYFRGMVAVSLRDGHVVSGELWGPLPVVIEVREAGGQWRESPIACFVQEVWMREMK